MIEDNLFVGSWDLLKLIFDVWGVMGGWIYVIMLNFFLLEVDYCLMLFYKNIVE